MNRNYEARTLKQVSKLLSSGERKPWSSVVISIILYLLAVIAIGGSYILVSRGVISGRFAVIVATFGGTFIGVASYFGVAMKQWPVIRPFIDRKSLEKRLSEIET